MKIKRTLADTPAPTYGAVKRGWRVQIVRTAPRLITLKRAYRKAGRLWNGQLMSFEDWYAEVVKFQREGGHEVK